MHGWGFNGEGCTTMAYKVHDTKRGHIFATLKEASAYADYLRRKTRVIVLVTECRAKATHVWEV